MRGVGVADGACVVCGEEGHSLGAHLHPLDAAQLVLGLLGCDAVQDEAALHIIQQPEELSSLLDRHHVHEASGVICVCADLAVHLDEALLDNLLHLSARQSVLEPIPQHDDERQGLPQLVGSGAGPGSEDSTELVQHP
ncbi:hypothetical protein MRX96_026689 [Rhipicephalus microplus]